MLGFNEILFQSYRVIDGGCHEIKLDWEMAWLVNPFVPLELRLDFLAVIFEGFGNKAIKSVSKVFRCC